MISHFSVALFLSIIVDLWSSLIFLFCNYTVWSFVFFLVISFYNFLCNTKAIHHVSREKTIFSSCILDNLKTQNDILYRRYDINEYASQFLILGGWPVFLFLSTLCVLLFHDYIWFAYVYDGWTRIGGYTSSVSFESIEINAIWNNKLHFASYTRLPQ